jgi:NAD(P)-dependent dehydrogenase (short-subunit alcohol dehydrogenase family)
MYGPYAPDICIVCIMAMTAIGTGLDSGIGKATAVALARDAFGRGIAWHQREPVAQAIRIAIHSYGRRLKTRQLDRSDLPGFPPKAPPPIGRASLSSSTAASCG